MTIQEFTKLTERWYKYVNQDHHKDRDCHFTIREHYSYGEPPKFHVEHFGYILHNLEVNSDDFDTAEEAREYIANEMLIEMGEREREL